MLASELEFVFPFNWYVLFSFHLFSVGKRSLIYLSRPSSCVTSFMKPLLTQLPPSELSHFNLCFPLYPENFHLCNLNFYCTNVFIKANWATVWLVAQGNQFLSAYHGGGYKKGVR